MIGATWWKELGVVVLIAVFPVLPVTVFGWSLLRRRQRARLEQEVTTGHASETPFAAIGAVSLFLTGVIVLFVLLVIVVRALVL